MRILGRVRGLASTYVDGYEVRYLYSTLVPALRTACVDRGRGSGMVRSSWTQLSPSSCAINWPATNEGRRSASKHSILAWCCQQIRVPRLWCSVSRKFYSLGARYLFSVAHASKLKRKLKEKNYKTNLIMKTVVCVSTCISLP